jgi:hypothetical protein
MTALRPELPTLPEKMRRLPVDERGYPVPWFVAWLDEDRNEVSVGEGKPDFRILRPSAIPEALKYEQCWVCGGKLGRYRSFVIGPMCMVNMTNAEPPSHRECADWSARACPFLSRPHMRRRENDLEENAYDKMPGEALLRNPGVGVVWTSPWAYHIKRVENGILFDLPEPSDVDFYTEGRRSMVQEIVDSVESGIPALLGLCETDEERQECLTKVTRTLSMRLPREPELQKSLVNLGA